MILSFLAILLPARGCAPTIEFYHFKEDVIIKTIIKNTLSLKYINKLAFLESGNNPDTVNTIGCIGLFQFSQSAINHLKLGFTVAEFKNDPSIFPKKEQIKALKEYTAYHKKVLGTYIKTHKNTYFNGVYITENGILAAAHLSGAGGVKRFFNNGYIAKDKNKTTVIDYMNLFKNI